MKITKLHQTPKVPYDLDGHIIAQSSCVEIIHLTLKPGQQIAKHINPKDVFFFVLEGKSMIETDDEKVLVQKDQCIFVEGGTNRGFDNISVSDFKVMVIKLQQ
ncbi:Cupin domain protein [anaerobic digester metagenome]